MRFEMSVEVGCGDEEFDKSFLEDEAAGRTPAVDRVGRGEGVNGGLGGDGPVAFFGGEAGELGGDEFGFWGEGSGFGPGELGGGVAGEMGNEESADFGVGGWRAPEGESLSGRDG